MKIEVGNEDAIPASDGLHSNSTAASKSWEREINKNIADKKNIRKWIERGGESGTHAVRPNELDRC